MAKVYDTATDLITFARLQAQNTTSGSSYLGSDGLLKFAAEDEPRIEYDGSDGSLKGLLIEEQRTNLITHSDFTGGWYNPNSTTDVRDVVGPDGLANSATTLTNTGAGNQFLYWPFTGPTGDQTLSVFLKKGTSATVTLAVENGGMANSVRTTFTFATETAVAATGGTGYTNETATVQNAGNGWYRVSLSFNATTAAQSLRIYAGDFISVVDTETTLIYGAQLEQGSFPTSYIPTSGSQSTRSPDIASIPVSAFGYNQTAGTVVVEYQAQEFTNETVWSLSDGTTSNRIQHTRLPTTYDLFVMYGGNIQALIRPNPTGSHSKVSTAFKDDSFSIAVGGTLGVPDTSGTVPIVNQMYLGSLNNVTEFLNGHIKSIKYYPRRLTDAQLQTLTS